MLFLDGVYEVDSEGALSKFHSGVSAKAHQRDLVERLCVANCKKQKNYNLFFTIRYTQATLIFLRRLF